MRRAAAELADGWPARLIGVAVIGVLLVGCGRAEETAPTAVARPTRRRWRRPRAGRSRCATRSARRPPRPPPTSHRPRGRRPPWRGPTGPSTVVVDLVQHVVVQHVVVVDHHDVAPAAGADRAAARDRHPRPRDGAGTDRDPGHRIGERTAGGNPHPDPRRWPRSLAGLGDAGPAGQRRGGRAPNQQRGRVPPSRRPGRRRRGDHDDTAGRFVYLVESIEIVGPDALWIVTQTYEHRGHAVRVPPTGVGGPAHRRPPAVVRHVTS